MAQLKDLLVTGAARILGKLYASEFVGKLTGNADSATKATKDSANQQINTTYIKGLSVSGKTITYTKGDNSTGTINTQDTNTTYSTGTASYSGTTKLYTGTGSATDGTMTQKAITDGLNSKLSLSGGKLTGKLEKSAGQFVYDTRATAGTAGYVLLCTLKITENYMNEPIEFTITRRSDQSTTRISIAFVSVENKDPGLSVFKVFGGTNDIWMYKSAASTWQLYVHKTEAYDNIGVLEYYHSNYMKGVSVTWGTSQVSAVPSGSVKATWGYTAGSSASVIDSNNSNSISLAYSKSGMKYNEYTWLAGWNGYELRAVDKTQFAAAAHTHNYAGSGSAGGSANSAVKLATARSINGTNFDGSGNITTANWGTARTITVGNTGKSVNGSGNVSWSLGEIGIHVSKTVPTASDGKNGDIWIVYE